jgi:hypothetical protein
MKFYANFRGIPKIIPSNSKEFQGIPSNPKEFQKSIVQ